MGQEVCLEKISIVLHTLKCTEPSFDNLINERKLLSISNSFFLSEVIAFFDFTASPRACVKPVTQYVKNHHDELRIQ